MASPPADERASDARGDEQSSTVTVGLLADPDLPDVIARRLADILPESLSQRISDRVSWTVEARCDPFEATAERSRLLDKARRRVQGTEWDIAICITDLPVRAEHGSFIADVSIEDGVALLSLPALGGFRLTRRTHDIVVALVDEIAGGLGVEIARTDPPPDLRRSTAGAISRRTTPDDRDIDAELVTRRGVLRLLAGLVRANRPWQLALGLSTALAGAAAGSAFGVLYSSTWLLATTMQGWRLAGATVGALAAFVTWLIVGHGLWERPAGSPGLVRLINISTVLTVLTGVVLFYAVLFVINILAAALVIPPEYLGQVLGRPGVGWGSYLRVALMATAMGMVAGAVGSGLEHDETVRSAAYSQREQQRRARQAG